jgi:hypothetical protein
MTELIFNIDKMTIAVIVAVQMREILLAIAIWQDK